MKNTWLIGILGLCVVFFNYLGFTASVKGVVMIALGLIISFIAFREVIRNKVVVAINKPNNETQKIKADGS